MVVRLTAAMAASLKPQINPGDSFNLFDVLGKRAQGAAAVVDVWQSRHGGSLAARVPSATWLPDSKLCRDLGVGTASAGGNLAGSAVLAVAEASRPPLLLESLGARRLEVAPDAVVALPVWVAGAVVGQKTDDCKGDELNAGGVDHNKQHHLKGDGVLLK